MRYRDILEKLLADSGKVEDDYSVSLGVSRSYVRQVINGHKDGSLGLIGKALSRAGIDPQDCLELPDIKAERQSLIARADAILKSRTKYADRLRDFIEDQELRLKEEVNLRVVVVVLSEWVHTHKHD